MTPCILWTASNGQTRLWRDASGVLKCDALNVHPLGEKFWQAATPTQVSAALRPLLGERLPGDVRIYLYGDASKRRWRGHGDDTYDARFVARISSDIIDWFLTVEDHDERGPLLTQRIVGTEDEGEARIALLLYLAETNAGPVFEVAAGEVVGVVDVRPSDGMAAEIALAEREIERLRAEVDRSVAADVGIEAIERLVAVLRKLR